MRARAAKFGDAPAIARIYNEGIDDRVATFETRHRTTGDVAGWFDGRHPVVVVDDDDGGVIAFAPTSQYRPRACYAGISEFSVYTARAARGRGAGKMAMEALIEAARAAGFWKLVSRVLIENTASRGLLRSVGLREVGVYERHGQLDGVWRDVAIVERQLCDLQPTLAGELIELRPLRAGDFEELHRVASDPLIWEQHPEPDRWKREVFERYFAGAMASKGALAIIERRRGRIIGSSRYWNLEPGREVEIGWTFLERSFWGGRYNGELKALMIEHALRFVPRVVFVVGENNLRSRKALEKIGATFAGQAARPGTVLYEIRRASVPES